MAVVRRAGVRRRRRTVESGEGESILNGLAGGLVVKTERYWLLRGL